MLFNASFFERNQKRLLQIANSRWLRWIVFPRLPSLKKLGWKIEKITPNSIHRRIVNGKTFKVEHEARCYSSNVFAGQLSFNLSPFAFLEAQNVRRFRFSPVGALGMITLWFLVRKGSDFPWYALPLFGTVSSIDYTRTNSNQLLNDGIATYSGARDATDAADQETPILNGNSNILHNSFIGGLYYVRKTGFVFDTSGVGAGSTVSAVTLTLYSASSGTNNANSDSLVCVNGNNLNVPCTLADFDQFSATSIGSMAYSTLNASGAHTITITDTSVVQVTGNTQIGFRSANEIANSTPTGINNPRITDGTAGDNPYITVTYTSGVTSTVTPQDNLAMLGVS